MYRCMLPGAARHEYNLGTVGVGMKENLYLKKGILAKNNGEMIEKIVRIIRELYREPASSHEIRRMLGLKGKGKTAFS